MIGMRKRSRFDLDAGYFPEIETPVIVLTFQTSCFETSHEQQHSSRYPPASSSVQTMCAAPPCDFN